MLLKRWQKSEKLLFLYFTTLTRRIGAIDVARYSIANGAEKFYLDATQNQNFEKLLILRANKALGQCSSYFLFFGPVVPEM